MRKWAPLILAAAAVAAATPGHTAVEKRRPPGLERVGGCGPFLAYAKQQALPLVGPFGLFGPRVVSFPRAVQFTPTSRGGLDYSTTNVQDEGVDEPDLVKTDGAHLFTASWRRLHAFAVRGIPRRLGTVAIPEGSRHELLLRGKRLLVLARNGNQPTFLPGGRRSPTRYAATTTLVEVDVSEPSAMRVVRALSIEGAYVSARLVGGIARVVTLSSIPDDVRFENPTTSDQQGLEAATARNREILAASALTDWLPSYTLTDVRGGRATQRSLVQCRHVMKPAAFSGFGLLTVLTLDLDRGLEIIDSDAVFGDGEIVYASPDSVYVATERWNDRPLPTTPFTAPAEVKTAIHKFAVTGRSTRYRATGFVPGYLLNQWSLSEHEQVLRVASSEAPSWWRTTDESASYVTTFAERDGVLSAIGRTEALGRGERIYAVRFAGDLGYVVTFRQIDPLYTLDLSDPAHPRVRGELKLLGYSAYLHPVGEDTLLGVGQDATEEGRLRGLQVSLFDVADPRRPRRIHQRTVARGGSHVEFDHHAFLYWRPERLVVLPVELYPDDRPPFRGAIGFRLSRAGGFEEVGRVAHHPDYPVLRSVVVGDALYTVSGGGVKVNGLRSFALREWIPYPEVRGS